MVRVEIVVPSLSTNERQTVEIAGSAEDVTVAQLQAHLAQHLHVPDTAAVRLIHGGRILRQPEQSLASYGIQEESSVVHVVLPASSSTSSSPSSATVAPSPTAHPMAQPFGGIAGQDPAMMEQMMQSPLMQSLTSNPELMRQLLFSNPQIQRMMESNPELAHVLDDRRFLEQMGEMTRNPRLMQEMMRNQDRSLSQLENIPGGFDALRRMYTSMEGSLSGGGGGASGGGTIRTEEEERRNRELAQRLNVSNVPEDRVNDQALPNPWAAPNPRAASQAQQQQHPPAPPFPTSSFPSATTPWNPFANSSSNMQSPPLNPFSNMAFPQQFMRPTMPMFGITPTQPPTQPTPALSTTTPTFTTTATTEEAISSAAERFPTELASMQEMGFSDRTKNVRALLAAGGNVQAAIEFLLSQM